MSKTSRSDTHLPRLSRTASVASDVSHGGSSSNSQRPKHKDRKRSGERVQILSEDGKNPGQVIDTSEDGWESGEGEDDKATGAAKANVETRDIRRTVSDSHAHKTNPATHMALVGSPLGMSNHHGPDHHHPMSTQRMKGFAGTVQTPASDPEMEAQAHHNEAQPHWNDPTHIMPAHQIRHQKSARSLHALAGNAIDGPSSLHAMSTTSGEKTPKPGSVVMSGPGKNVSRDSRPPPQAQRMRYTDESGLPPPKDPSLSPSFPFPKVKSPPAKTQQPTPPASADSDAHHRVPSGPPAPVQTRSRLASGTEHPRLRHRRSNSSLRSLRSIQSLRAPPHLLNSPTGYRTGLPTTSTSRGGSAFNSPSKGENRGLRMHHPPLAPPVVYREVASGKGWDIPEDAHYSLETPRGSSALDRKSSFSSQRSLQGILSQSTSRNKAQVSPSPSTGSPGPTLNGHLQSSRRRTALEVASAASKMPTTNDPALYHHSLGYPSTSAETAHLISRFLPPRKVRRPHWEITAENMDGHSGVGLSRGDYRDAHESLVRMMKDMGMPHHATGRRSMSRALSSSLLGSTTPGTTTGTNTPDDGGSAIGLVRGRNGMMVVMANAGGWGGKSPFELSVERCLAQRPARAAIGV